MSYYYDKNWVPNFNVRPVFPIKDTCSWKGNDAIVCALKDRIAKEGKEKLVVTFDYMYGFDESVLLEKVIKQLGAATLIDTNEAKYPEPVIQEKFGKYITEDRIMGVYIPDQVDAFFDPAAVEKQRRAIQDAKGLVVVYGVAAEVVCGGDVLVYCNVTEKTIGDRMRRKGLGNWGADNGGDEFLKRQKRNNFVEKRVLYWHRTVILPVIDYMMDCNDEEALVMVDRETFDKGVNSMAHRPYQSCPHLGRRLGAEGAGRRPQPAQRGLGHPRQRRKPTHHPQLWRQRLYAGGHGPYLLPAQKDHRRPPAVLARLPRPRQQQLSGHLARPKPLAAGTSHQGVRPADV